MSKAKECSVKIVHTRLVKDDVPFGEPRFFLYLTTTQHELQVLGPFDSIEELTPYLDDFFENPEEYVATLIAGRKRWIAEVVVARKGKQQG